MGNREVDASVQAVCSTLELQPQGTSALPASPRNAGETLEWVIYVPFPRGLFLKENPDHADGSLDSPATPFAPIFASTDVCSLRAQGNLEPVLAPMPSLIAALELLALAS